MKLIDRLNKIDLTKIVYPIIILITGLYIIPNLYKLASEWNRPPMIVATFIVYVIVFTLVPIGFAYLALKKVKLEFKFSFLSVIGIILIIVFSRGLIEYLSQGHSLLEILNIGADHWLFPIAFGFFYLCDLSKIPKKFWLMLLPFAVFAGILGSAIIIGNSIFNRNLFQAIGGPNFPFLYFGANNWQEVLALPSQRILDGFIDGFLQEFLTFQILFPVVIFYHVFRRENLK